MRLKMTDVRIEPGIGGASFVVLDDVLEVFSTGLKLICIPTEMLLCYKSPCVSESLLSDRSGASKVLSTMGQATGVSILPFLAIRLWQFSV